MLFVTVTDSQEAKKEELNQYRRGSWYFQDKKIEK